MAHNPYQAFGKREQDRKNRERRLRFQAHMAEMDRVLGVLQALDLNIGMLTELPSAKEGEVTVCIPGFVVTSDRPFGFIKGTGNNKKAAIQDFLHTVADLSNAGKGLGVSRMTRARQLSGMVPG